MTPIPSSLPFDNLYKFASVLFVAVGIASMMAIVSLTNSHNDYVKENAKEMVEIMKGVDVDDNDNAYLKLLSNLTAGAQKNILSSITVLMISGIISLSLSGMSLYLWYIRDQKLRDELLHLELQKRIKELRLGLEKME